MARKRNSKHGGRGPEKPNSPDSHSAPPIVPLTKESSRHETILRPLDIPSFVENYGGREFKEGILLMANELEEFEPLVTGSHMPLHEVVEYLGVINFFDSYPQFIDHLAQIYKKNSVEKLHQMVSQSYTLEAANKKIIGVLNALLQKIKDKERPLLRAVFQDLMAVYMHLIMEQDPSDSWKKINEEESDGAWEERMNEQEERQLAASQAIFDWSDKQLGEKKMQSAFHTWPLLAEISYLLKKDDTPEEIRRQEKIHGDALAQRLKAIHLEPGVYTLNHNTLFRTAERVTLEKTADDEQLLWGKIYIRFLQTNRGEILRQMFEKNDSSEARELIQAMSDEPRQYIDTCLYISYFTGDINPQFNMISSLEFFYGETPPAQYYEFRDRLLGAIVSGIEAGHIQIKPESSDEMVPEGENSTPVSDEENIETLRQQILAIEEDETVDVAPPADVVIEASEEPVGTQGRDETTTEKTPTGRMSRNITRTNALHILTSEFNVQETPGTKHAKLSRIVEGRIITVPFPNPHSSGVKNRFPYILRRVLRFLHINWRDFAERL